MVDKNDSNQNEKGLYDGNLNIYCHKNLKDVILTISKLTIQKKFFDMIGQRIFINIVKDEDELNICNHDFTFFDIRSSKAEQYGFKMVLDNKKVLVFCGDEPYQPHEEKYAFNCDYLLHEAFCKYTDREIFLPYEKSHTTVKEASENATNLNAKTLILYHTEDKNLPERKYLYSSEAKAYFSGTVIVPDDLDIINL